MTGVEVKVVTAVNGIEQDFAAPLFLQVAAASKLTMPFITRPVDLIRAIHCGLVVLCCILAPLAATAHVLRDLGTLGVTHSFRMGMDTADQVTGNPFTASNAVRHTTLSSISGSGNFGPGPLSSTPHLVIGIDDSGQLQGSDHRVHIADEHPAMLRASGGPKAAPSTRGGTYSYSRDIDNKLWWAVLVAVGIESRV